MHNGLKIMKKFILISSLFIFSLFSESYIFSSNLGDISSPLRLRGEYGQTIQYSVNNYELGSGYGCGYWVSMTIKITNGIGYRYRTLSNWIDVGETWNFSIDIAKNEIIVGESAHIIGGYIDETIDDANSDYFWGGESCHSDSNDIGTHWGHISGKSYEVGEDIVVKPRH